MGGGSSETQKAEMDPLQKEILKSGYDYINKNILEDSFTPYSGKRFAGLTPEETQNIQDYLNMDTGQQSYQTAQNVAAGIAQETPAQRMARVQQYSGMFDQNVIDPTIQAMDYQRAKQRLGEYDTRTGAKAFGSRGDVYLGAKEGEYETGLAQTIANLKNQGLQFGQQTVSAEDQSRLGAAGQLASTAGAGVQTAIQALGAKGAAAAMPRTMDQQTLDFLYNEEMRRLADPYQRAASITGYAGTVPTGYGTTTTSQDLGLGGTLSAVGAFGQGMGAMGFMPFSDARLKKNVKMISGDGPVNFYTWEWTDEANRIGTKGHPTMGVIAQELEKTHPQYVVTGDDGYKRVNYNGLYRELGMA